MKMTKEMIARAEFIVELDSLRVDVEYTSSPGEFKHSLNNIIIAFAYYYCNSNDSDIKILDKQVMGYFANIRKELLSILTLKSLKCVNSSKILDEALNMSNIIVLTGKISDLLEHCSNASFISFDSDKLSDIIDKLSNLSDYEDIDIVSNTSQMLKSVICTLNRLNVDCVLAASDADNFYYDQVRIY